MRMPELKALARDRRLRCYFHLRKAELVVFSQDNECQALRPPQPSPQMSTWEPNRPPQRHAAPAPQMSTCEPESEQEQPELEAPLTKRQLKHRRKKDSKLAKKFKILNPEISNLKSQMDALKDKITRASMSTNTRFKREKTRSMKREADRINEKLRDSKKPLNW